MIVALHFPKQLLVAGPFSMIGKGWRGSRTPLLAGLFCIAAAWMPPTASAQSEAAATPQPTEQQLRQRLATAAARHGAEAREVLGPLYELANFLEQRHRYPEAGKVRLQALSIEERVHGTDHPEVAASLDKLAWNYHSMGEYTRALQVFTRSLAIREQVLGRGHPDVASSLNYLGRVHESMGEYARALPLYERSLAIREEALGSDHSDVAVSLNNLALVYKALGDSANAILLFERSLAIREQGLGRKDGEVEVATVLINLAVLYESMSEYARALPLLQRSLAILEQARGPEHLDVATTLNNLASLYDSMGEYALALPLYERSLAIRELALGQEHRDVAGTLNNLALLYRSMGEYARALASQKRSVVIYEKVLGHEHPHVAASLNNLAVVYRAMGDYARALPLQVRSLSMFEKTLSGGHRNVAASLNNLAQIYLSMGEYARALPLSERSVAIREQALGKEHPDVAQSLNHLAELYALMGEYPRARPLYERSLALREKALGREHPDVASSLNNLAVLYVSMGEPAKALPLAQRALPIALRAGNPDLLWRVQNSLGDLARAQRQPQLAIFWLKESVNTIQGLRGRMVDLHRELQQSFLSDKRSVYTRLADLLIEQGRLAEAGEVLGLLKEHELHEFVRGEGDARQRQATRTGVEPALHAGYQVHGEKLAALGRELDELVRKARLQNLSESERARRSELERALDAARGEFEQFLAGMEHEVARLARDNRERGREIDARRLSRLDELQETLTSLSERSGAPVAALHYLVTDTKVRIIVTLPSTQIGREQEVPIAELHRQIQAFREALQDPGVDPRPLAAQLYRVLIAPVEDDLRAAKVTTLMLSLDERLRYLPFAALHDGQQYLLERYRLAMYTEAARDKQLLVPRADWTAAGLGMTAAVKVSANAVLTEARAFSSLPQVAEELKAIVRTEGESAGVLPGERHLDGQFNDASLQRALDRRHPVVHLASHFSFRPGSEVASYLVLGDGQALSLADLKSSRFRFGAVELLTLSACETALGGGLNDSGREIEGFGALAQQKGAHGVLASLWQVNDASTAQLMAAFYRERGARRLSKAEALRQAQLALMGSTQTASQAAARSGLTRPGAAGAQRAGPPFTTDPARPYAHPYYWAAFILMGNWL